MSTEQANGSDIEASADPAAFARAQMVMAVRQLETKFPGCHVTIFVADPAKPTEFNHATSAPISNVVAMLYRFLREAK